MRMKLPIAFENRMKKLLGEEYAAFARALTEEDAVKGLRVNRHKLAVETFAAHAPWALERLEYTPDGFIVSDEAQAGKHPYHAAGVYYMQDPGAMATVAALPASVWERTDLKILDLCAAPGGKTTQLAAASAARGGVVLANEYNAARSRILAGNVERMGLSNVCVTNTDTKFIAEWYPDYFDLVAVDAPCSGEGMFRKNDRAIEEWSPENVSLSASRQREILENGGRCVAPGGYLLYSTCTYSTEENEEQVVAFLHKHPDFSLVPCAEAVSSRTSDGIAIEGAEGIDLSLCRRFYPHVSRGEGQFVALMKRDPKAEMGGRMTKGTASMLSKTDRATCETFLKETLGYVPEGLSLCGSNAVLFERGAALGFPTPPAGAVAIGAALGELRKGRIVPHHHFFTAYGKKMKHQCILDACDPAVAQYLAGEEITAPTALSGWCAVLLRVGDTAVTLGGGKAVGGRLKNHYPKGLRVR